LLPDLFVFLPDVVLPVDLFPEVVPVESSVEEVEFVEDVVLVFPVDPVFPVEPVSIVEEVELVE
jgi:hypothetical protein